MIFTKSKFIETMGKEHYKLISSDNKYNWVDEADGKKVKNGYVEIMRGTI